MPGIWTRIGRPGLLAGIVAAGLAAAPAAAQQLPIVTAEDGQTFLLNRDGTYEAVTVANDPQGGTFVLYADGTWERIEAYVAPIDVRFREAVLAAVRRFEEGDTEAEMQQATDCLMQALSPLDAEDKQALIDVGMDPDRDMTDRLETKYPGLEDAVERCI